MAGRKGLGSILFEEDGSDDEIFSGKNIKQSKPAGPVFKKKQFKNPASRRVKRRAFEEEEDEKGTEPATGEQASSTEEVLSESKLSQIKKYSKLKDENGEDGADEDPVIVNPEKEEEDEKPVIVNMENEADNAQVLEEPAKKYVPNFEDDNWKPSLTIQNEYGEDEEDQENVANHEEYEDMVIDNEDFTEDKTSATELIKQSRIRAGIHTNDSNEKSSIQVNQDFYDLELSDDQSINEDEQTDDKNYKVQSLSEMVSNLSISTMNLKESITEKEAELQDIESQLSEVKQAKENLMMKL